MWHLTRLSYSHTHIHLHTHAHTLTLTYTYTGDDLEASEYRAVFTYKSETQGDLRFSEGEMVLVYWADENGWWFGSAGSAQGWFPGSYVEVRTATGICTWH